MLSVTKCEICGFFELCVPSVPEVKQTVIKLFISGFAAVHLSGFYTYSSHLQGPVSAPLPLRLFHHTSAGWCCASAPAPEMHIHVSISKRKSTLRKGSIDEVVSSRRAYLELNL